MQKGITLLCGAEIPSELIFKPIAAMAGQGARVFVLDGENAFRSYAVARSARALGLNPRHALAQVQVARAFTCYQMTDLVARVSARVGAGDAAIVCLGLLGTFYDEDVPLPDARRLLQHVIAALLKLAEDFPILITVRPPPLKAKPRVELVYALMQQADTIRLLDPDSVNALPAPLPLALEAGK
jgi:hypothetical protein